MSQLSQFLSFCNLSYIGLVTGDDVEALYVILGGKPMCMSVVVCNLLLLLHFYELKGVFYFLSRCVEENDDVLRWFPLAKQGALIAGL